MKRRDLVILCCALPVMAVVGSDRANGGTIQPVAIAGPNISSDVLQVASKKKRGKKSGGRKYNRGVTHLEALTMCRKEYGRSNVVRVTIRKDGFIVCHVEDASPDSKGNYNRKQ